MKDVLDSNTEEEFEEEWSKFEQICSSRGVQGATFSHYMNTYKKDLMKKCLIGQVRERCGLGSPPQKYRENPNECENSVIIELKESKVLIIKEAMQ